MTSKEKIKRLMLEIQQLRRNPVSLSEIQDFLKEESNLQGYDFNMSKRAFPRNVEEIDYFS